MLELLDEKRRKKKFHKLLNEYETYFNFICWKKKGKMFEQSKKKFFLHFRVARSVESFFRTLNGIQIHVSAFYFSLSGFMYFREIFQYYYFSLLIFLDFYYYWILLYGRCSSCSLLKQLVNECGQTVTRSIYLKCKKMLCRLTCNVKNMRESLCWSW